MQHFHIHTHTYTHIHTHTHTHTVNLADSLNMTAPSPARFHKQPSWTNIKQRLLEGQDAADERDRLLPLAKPAEVGGLYEVEGLEPVGAAKALEHMPGVVEKVMAEKKMEKEQHHDDDDDDDDKEEEEEEVEEEEIKTDHSEADQPSYNYDDDEYEDEDAADGSNSDHSGHAQGVVIKSFKELEGATADDDDDDENVDSSGRKIVTPAAASAAAAAAVAAVAVPGSSAPLTAAASTKPASKVDNKFESSVKNPILGKLSGLAATDSVNLGDSLDDTVLHQAGSGGKSTGGKQYSGSSSGNSNLNNNSNNNLSGSKRSDEFEDDNHDDDDNEDDDISAGLDANAADLVALLTQSANQRGFDLSPIKESDVSHEPSLASTLQSNINASTLTTKPSQSLTASASFKPNATLRNPSSSVSSAAAAAVAAGSGIPTPSKSSRPPASAAPASLLLASSSSLSTAAPHNLHNSVSSLQDGPRSSIARLHDAATVASSLRQVDKIRKPDPYAFAVSGSSNQSGHGGGGSGVLAPWRPAGVVSHLQDPLPELPKRTYVSTGAGAKPPPQHPTAHGAPRLHQAHQPGLSQISVTDSQDDGGRPAMAPLAHQIGGAAALKYST